MHEASYFTSPYQPLSTSIPQFQTRTSNVNKDIGLCGSRCKRSQPEKKRFANEMLLYAGQKKVDIKKQKQ